MLGLHANSASLSCSNEQAKATHLVTTHVTRYRRSLLVFSIDDSQEITLIFKSSSADAVHFINPLWDPNGGADRRTIATWDLVRERADTHLWSEYDPVKEFTSAYPVRKIRRRFLSFPRRGTFVFMGVYFRIGHWIWAARPDRIIVIYNTDQPDRLDKNLRRIAGCGVLPEVVSSSQALNRKLGLELPILESPIDLAPFLGLGATRLKLRMNRVFTVGRLSRDDDYKHHAEDPALYKKLAASGCRVRIMGGTCLSAALAGTPNIELLPAGAEDQATFLRSLDCFIYRTSETWFEAFGRVIFEAMASGLPVVAAQRGGYADYLNHGHDSLLFASTASALAHVERLRGDDFLRRSMGEAASATARRVVGEPLSERTRQFLLQTKPLMQKGISRDIVIA
jgi:glycosyltransferase involved in cell wall biosynthesis